MLHNSHYSFAAHPWFATTSSGTTVIRDRDARKICELSPDPIPSREIATANLIKHAPALLITVRLAYRLLLESEDHPELAEHLRKVIERCQPEVKWEAEKLRDKLDLAEAIAQSIATPGNVTC